MLYSGSMLESINGQSIKILVADDSTSIRTYLKEILTQWGYEVEVCSDGDQVWERLCSDEFYPILILDWIMPGLTGIELCKKIKQCPADLYQYIIMLTSKSDTADIVEALNNGADDYLSKPFAPEVLKARMTTGRRMYDFEQRLRLKEKEDTINHFTKLTEVAETRDSTTGTHLTRVALLSSKLAKALKQSNQYCYDIYQFAPMHDVGKLAVPDEIIQKPGKLTEKEFEIIKGHPRLGHEILKDHNLMKMADAIAYTHHEKWNGTGYPRGLSGENIPLEGRIVSVADVYDALRSNRPYKEGFSHEKAVNIILAESGISFDPQIIEVFDKVNRDLEQIFNNLYNPHHT